MKMFLLGAFFASSVFLAVHTQQSTQTQRTLYSKTTP